MKAIVVLNHPAHYYLFKYIISELKNKNYEIKLLIREKDVLENLLILEKQKYTKICNREERQTSFFKSLIQNFSELQIKNFNLYKIATTFHPSVMFGTDASISHVGKLLDIPSLIFNEDDYEINKFFCRTAYPFATSIICPHYTSVGPYGSKKVSYNGIQKMAYLNPKYFKPDSSILTTLNLREQDPFFIIRTVSLTAIHDLEGKSKGIDILTLELIIKMLEKEGKVFISTEKPLPHKFKKYILNIEPNKLHDLMYYCKLFIGDSQTMCAESGILGTPFIRFNNFIGKINYLEDLENNYKLGWGVKSNNRNSLFEKIKMALRTSSNREEWKKRKKKLFLEKEDLVSFSVKLIERAYE